MDEEIKREYERHLMTAVLKHGQLVAKDASFYGWQDYEDEWADRQPHQRTCAVTGAMVREWTWHEFMGTFYEGDTSVHGVVVRGVNCACGHLVDREVRWSAHPSEIAKAVFEELYREDVPDAVWEFLSRFEVVRP